MTNNDLQHFTQKRLCNTKPTKNWGDFFGAPGELEIPAPLVTYVVLLLNDTEHNHILTCIYDNRNKQILDVLQELTVVLYLCL